MSLGAIEITTTGSQGEVLATAPLTRQYEFKFLSAYKGSTFTLNISKQTASGYITIFAETVTDGGSVISDDAIILNPGESLISQSSTAGININGTYQENSAQ
jgi:hypothetical protein